MTTQWTPVGISSISTPDGELHLQNARGNASLTVRQSICDAMNAAQERKRPKSRLPTKAQLMEFARGSDQPGERL